MDLIRGFCTVGNLIDAEWGEKYNSELKENDVEARGFLLFIFLPAQSCKRSGRESIRQTVKLKDNRRQNHRLEIYDI